MEATLKVSGMHCASCEKVISMALEDVPGAKVISANSKTGVVKVSAADDKTLAAVKKAIAAEGYKVQ